jgi:hypothetical protein
MPSVVIGTQAVLPATVTRATGCAPVALKVIDRTPEPPVSSVAVGVTVTLARFQPAAFGRGIGLVAVVGARVSPYESFTTKALPRPRNVRCNAPGVVGKLAEAVRPVT